MAIHTPHPLHNNHTVYNHLLSLFYHHFKQHTHTLISNHSLYFFFIFYLLLLLSEFEIHRIVIGLDGPGYLGIRGNNAPPR